MANYSQTIGYKSDKHLKMLVLFIALGKIAGFSYGNAAFFDNANLVMVMHNGNH